MQMQSVRCLKKYGFNCLLNFKKREREKKKKEINVRKCTVKRTSSLLFVYFIIFFFSLSSLVFSTFEIICLISAPVLNKGQLKLFYEQDEFIVFLISRATRLESRRVLLRITSGYFQVRFKVAFNFFSLQ